MIILMQRLSTLDQQLFSLWDQGGEIAKVGIVLMEYINNNKLLTHVGGIILPLW